MEYEPELQVAREIGPAGAGILAFNLPPSGPPVADMARPAVDESAIKALEAGIPCRDLNHASIWHRSPPLESS